LTTFSLEIIYYSKIVEVHKISRKKKKEKGKIKIKRDHDFLFGP
jgi:hypothetical protein